jgi:hypothetical protein
MPFMAAAAAALSSPGYAQPGGVGGGGGVGRGGMMGAFHMRWAQGRSRIMLSPRGHGSAAAAAPPLRRRAAAEAPLQGKQPPCSRPRADRLPQVNPHHGWHARQGPRHEHGGRGGARGHRHAGRHHHRPKAAHVHAKVSHRPHAHASTRRRHGRSLRRRLGRGAQALGGVCCRSCRRRRLGRVGALAAAARGGAAARCLVVGSGQAVGELGGVVGIAGAPAIYPLKGRLPAEDETWWKGGRGQMRWSHSYRENGRRQAAGKARRAMPCRAARLLAVQGSSTGQTL